MLLTMTDISRQLGVSQKIAREIVRTLPAIKVGRRLRYSDDVLAEFVKSGIPEKTQPESHA